MMAQAVIMEGSRSKLLKLIKKRNNLRNKLKNHFSLPVGLRNYKDFELVVDELDNVRKKIQELKQG